MRNDNPRVSIIIPVYNVANYLQFCIDSIIAQSFTLFEVLLIDDGSVDDSGTICDSISQIDERFRVIHQKNQGPGAARNAGLKVAKGDYISFIDADDYVGPTMLEDMIHAIEITNADMAIVDFYSVSESVWKDVSSDDSFSILDGDKLFEGMFLKSVDDLQYIFIWNKLYKKELLDGLNFIDGKCSEDAEFNSRVYARVKRTVKLNKSLYYYRQRNDSLTGNAEHLVASQWAIDNMKVYADFILNIPQKKHYWRALGLLRLYKRMLNIRYYNRKTEWRQQSENLARKIFHDTCHEFMASKYVGYKNKLIYPFLYYFPFFYNTFMWYCNYRSK